LNLNKIIEKRKHKESGMKKYLTAAIIAVIFCTLNAQQSFSKTLSASATDSTGIVGLVLTVGLEPVPIINEVFSNTPASKAGLQPGDRVVAIDNRPTYGMSKTEVDYAIPDTPGQNVLLNIIRNNQYYTYKLQVVPLHLSNQQTQMLYTNY
jgi:carboxyl-terminal processing protease